MANILSTYLRPWHEKTRDIDNWIKTRQNKMWLPPQDMHSSLSPTVWTLKWTLSTDTSARRYIVTYLTYPVHCLQVNSRSHDISDCCAEVWQLNRWDGWVWYNFVLYWKVFLTGVGFCWVDCWGCPCWWNNIYFENLRKETKWCFRSKISVHVLLKMLQDLRS